MADKPTDTRSSYFTPARISGDLNYHRAQRIAKNLLDAALISTDEFDKLTAINRETFSPLFSEIMPKSLDM